MPACPHPLRRGGLRTRLMRRVLPFPDLPTRSFVRELDSASSSREGGQAPLARTFERDRQVPHSRPGRESFTQRPPPSRGERGGRAVGASPGRPSRPATFATVLESPRLCVPAAPPGETCFPPTHSHSWLIRTDARLHGPVRLNVRKTVQHKRTAEPAGRIGDQPSGRADFRAAAVAPGALYKQASLIGRQAGQGPAGSRCVLALRPWVARGSPPLPPRLYSAVSIEPFY